MDHYASEFFYVFLYTNYKGYLYHFDPKHAIRNQKNIYKFQGIRRIFMRARACTGRLDKLKL